MYETLPIINFSTKYIYSNHLLDYTAISTMADGVNKELSSTDVFNDKKDLEKNQNLDDLGVNDAGVIPKGTIDPVYEAKARVLNHAVGALTTNGVKLTTPDPRDWNGMVPM